MESRLGRIEDKLDKILDKVSTHGVKIAEIETRQSGMVKISFTLWSAFTGICAFLAQKVF